MPEFIILIRDKTRGARVVAEVPDLQQQIEQAARSCGVRLKEFKYLFGRYHLALTCEFDDYPQITSFSAAVEKLASLETESLWVLAKEDLLQLLQVAHPELTLR